MNLSDQDLRAQLERRATSTDLPSDAVARITGALASIEQSRRRRLAMPGTASRPVLAGIGAAVAVAVALAIILPSTAPGPAATGTPPPAAGSPSPRAGYPAERPLSSDELARLLPEFGPAPAMGEHVIADVDIEPTIPCLGPVTGVPEGCAGLALAGINPIVPVNPGPAGVDPTPGRSPYLLWLRPGRSVDVLGFAQRAPERLSWGFPALAAEIGRRAAEGLLDHDEVFLVDGWLVGMGMPPSCPFPGTAPRHPEFACGEAAWLTPAEEQPTSGSATNVSVRAPGDGFRVQNGAYSTFARGPDRLADPPRTVPRRGWYVVRAVDPTVAAGCFLCPPLGALEIVARLDPIEVPAPRPTPSATVPVPSPDARSPLSGAQILAAFPDSNLPESTTQETVATARAFAIDPANGLDLRGHLLLAAIVDADLSGYDPDLVEVVFHDYSASGVVRVWLRFEGGAVAKPLVAVQRRFPRASATPSGWERARLDAILAVADVGPPGYLEPDGAHLTACTENGVGWCVGVPTADLGAFLVDLRFATVDGPSVPEPPLKIPVDPSDAGRAHRAAGEFATLALGGGWDGAWKMLSPWARGRFGSPNGFGLAFDRGLVASGPLQIGEPMTDETLRGRPALLDVWQDLQRTADMARAFYLRSDRGALVVAPLLDGADWAVWPIELEASPPAN